MFVFEKSIGKTAKGIYITKIFAFKTYEFNRLYFEPNI